MKISSVIISQRYFIFLVVGAVLAIALIIVEWKHLPAFNAAPTEYRAILADSDQVLRVMVAQKGDDIFVLNADTKQLVFEFNRRKTEDSSDYLAYNGLLIEAKFLAEKQKTK